MDQEVSLKSMILAFRVTELQTLLSYAGKNRSGRKNELQARAMELMKSNKAAVNAKIRELYQSIQLSNLAQQPPASAGVVNSSGQILTASNLAQPRQGSYTSNLNRMYSTGAYAGAADKVLLGKNPYNNSGYAAVGVNRININTPICPDVQLKKLPFYDIRAVLHKPTTLIAHHQGRGVQESHFNFCFKPSEASEVASSKEYNYGATGDSKIQYTTQVQLRLCVVDLSSDQDDAFPPNLGVKVNNKMITLPQPIPSNRPGVEPKRPSRPLNVTNYCKLSPTVTNVVQVSWVPDVSGKSYCISLYMVKKLCSKDLLGRLKAKGARPADYTRGMIKEICQKDDADCFVATTSLKVSLACPLGKSRMTIPCRASTCSHLQCFDANLFIQMNEKKPTWICPVCDKSTLFDNLAIDGYFEDVISKVRIDEGNDIEIGQDAEWNVSVKSDEPPTKKSRSAAPAKLVNKTVCLDDDDDILIDDEDDDEPIEKASTTSTAKEKENEKPANAKASVVVVDLTSSTDEEEEEEEPVLAPAPPVHSNTKSPVKKIDFDPVPLQPKKVVDDDDMPARRESREKERSKSPVKSSSSTRGVGKDKEDGEVKESSDDEEDKIRPVRRALPSRSARPTFLHDESSNSSNSSDSSASTRAPDSPQCITLESDDSSTRSTPSPPEYRSRSKVDSHKSKSGSGSSSGRAGTSGDRDRDTGSSRQNTVASSFLSSGSVFGGGSSSLNANSAPAQPAASTNYATSLSYPTAGSSLPNPRYNDGNYSASGGYQSGAAYRAANAAPVPPILRQPQVDHYSSGSYISGGGYDWDGAAFSNPVTDFGALEFPSMDFFNQAPSSYGSSSTGSNSNYNGRGGTGSSYGGWR